MTGSGRSAWGSAGRAGTGKQGPTASRGDRGSVTPVLLAGVGLLVGALALALVLLAPVTARHRASVAADLGALSGAPAAVLGEGEACARAARVVAANGAQVRRCDLVGNVLDLTVVVPVRLTAAWSGEVTARARAGPS